MSEVYRTELGLFSNELFAVFDCLCLQGMENGYLQDSRINLLSLLVNHQKHCFKSHCWLRYRWWKHITRPPAIAPIVEFWRGSPNTTTFQWAVKTFVSFGFSAPSPATQFILVFSFLFAHYTCGCLLLVCAHFIFYVKKKNVDACNFNGYCLKSSF